MSRQTWRYWIFALVAGVSITACGDDTENDPEVPDTGSDVDTGPTECVSDGIPYCTLSEYEFFEGDMREMQPAARVYPYDVNATLWADGSGKGRFFYLPEGTKIARGDDEEWDFPDGAIVIKNFTIPLDLRQPDGEYRIVETRLLVRDGGSYDSYTYVWDEEETEATRLSTGTRIPYSVIDAEGEPFEGEYVVPTWPQCRQCHERANDFGQGAGVERATHLLGLVTPQVDMMVEHEGEMVNQIAWLAEQDVFADESVTTSEHPPLVDPLNEAETLEDRARSYMHANCAHCHRPGGAAARSGLFLMRWQEDESRLGFCKQPVAPGAGTGGLFFDIVPGNSAESILTFRMNSTDPQIKMPELTNLLVDDFGVELVEDWIDSLEAQDCGPTGTD